MTRVRNSDNGQNCVNNIPQVAKCAGKKKNTPWLIPLSIEEDMRIKLAYINLLTLRFLCFLQVSNQLDPPKIT